jgi:hypothetical protein
MPTSPIVRRSVRNIAVGVSAAFVLFIGGGAARIRYLQGGADYSHVTSIKTAWEFQDSALLARAWALPVASIYKGDGVDWQENPSFCGPTSAVNVMRSLGEQADQHSILAGTHYWTVFGLLPGGMTLDDLAALVREKSGKHVDVLRDIDLATFRRELAHANDPSRRYIINFHRGPLFGTGGGHFSPIAGYLESADLVLVLDVNRKYQPWLVPTERLFQAMDTVDRSAGRKRGLLRIQ